MPLIAKSYRLLVRRDVEAEQDLPEPVRRDVARNGMRLVAANTLQSSGDQTVNASTVLPWLFHALGVPPALTGLLVPVRESGSMLPQALLTPLILRAAYRKWVFVAGAVVQASAVAGMAATAALGRGAAAGVVIIAALAVFSLGRCLCSVASKDVQGRTVPKGERGQIIGLATSAAGLVAITLGLMIRLLGGEEVDPGNLAWLLGAGVVLWVGAAAVYAGVREPPGDDDPAATRTHDTGSGWFAQTLRLLRTDVEFRRFVTMRSFLLVSALSPPFVVTLSVHSGSGSLAGLGGFVLASGVAALLGGRIFGRLADRSSRNLMVAGAAGASAVIIALVVFVSLPGFDGGSAAGTGVLVAGYFLLTLLHVGVRVGRKTYVVDMAAGDLRTTYVAVSNSAMGLVLLIVGGISSAVATAGVEWALVLLAVMGAFGVVAGLRMPDVSR